MILSDLFVLLGVCLQWVTAPSLLGEKSSRTPQKDEFIENLVSQMTVPELVVQLHLMFADNIIGPKSENELYDFALQSAPDAALGAVHDWYPLNTSRYNDLQKLNLDNSGLKVPFMHYGECLHGVGSYKQSIFPQALAMAASWDVDMVHQVGRAIGTEARSIGIHACLSPVLDLCKDPRFGRCQENWGEDKVLTAHMGVAYASGLSKNGSWDEPDAVAPVMKHFAAYGGPQSGINGAPWMGHGNREVLEDLLLPFKAAWDLGSVRGVMMSYNELDDVPAHVNPMLYQALDDWGFDGFITADDTGMKQLQTGHRVAISPADAIQQWFNAGGMIQFYDYPLEVYVNTTIALVANQTVSVETLQSKIRQILGVKYDLGLFDNPFIPDNIDPVSITNQNVQLTLDAAHRSIVLLKNDNFTLPLNPAGGGTSKVALIGPTVDTLNFGDYSGQYGALPEASSSTLRQGVINFLQEQNSSTQVLSSWGANTWLYNAQYPIPGYHLSANGTTGGLSATYFADTDFKTPLVHTTEVPALDWGLYPPPGLPSNNFSAIWEGELNVPTDTEVDGWLGVAIGPNSTAKVFIDGSLLVNVPLTTAGNILSNIPPLSYSLANSTQAPPGSAPFTFQPNAVHKIRIEFQVWNLYQKIENVNSLNGQVILFWNLVDRTSPIDKAISIAKDADVIVLAVGAAWNSDGEGGDRATLGLSPNQTALADAIFALNKPVVLVLEGGRPFAIQDYYTQSSAVLNAFFPGQSGGRAIADVLFGAFNTGGRMPLSIPKYAGQLPIYYNYKSTAHANAYTDVDPHPSYPFGFGLSYTTFSITNFHASSSGQASNTFTSGGDTITFTVDVTNNGTVAGSYVAQVYLLQRVSQITQAVKQLVAFQRVYLDAGQKATVSMTLEVDRYLQILNRKYVWELERGDYTFALLEHGGFDADTGTNVTMICT